MQNLFAPHLMDIICLAASAGLFSSHHLYVRHKLKTNPTYSLYGATTLARTAWVVNVMEEKNDILAVQTLRNSTMAATFLASTSILLAVGLLTLSGQADKLGETWHALNLFGSRAESTITLKLLVILGNLFIAFFNFSFAIRLFSHVGFLINTPPEEGSYGASITFVAMELNKAGSYFHMGMRAYYFLVPLIFWLFSPLFMLVATITLVALMSRIEKTPPLDCEYLGGLFKNSCPMPRE
ncbi:DUF599 domain-containing protein [Desulfovibrio sp. Huiquan2017]|uniref:DUF599 domain-containing protein n=1 Tax=Desulfovibrio sp. Huiquan2017 TaxID=2816861 RepID=UPI001A928647|nr:DUF599 domain-containing protein [Desulfovibrio sp. Huiquan2017]